MNAPVTTPSLLQSGDCDPAVALEILQGALHGADDGELFLERTESEMLVFDDGRLKSAAYDTGEGFGLRVVAGESAGYAHAAGIDEAALRRAGDAASLAKRGHSGVAAQGPRGTNARLYGEEDVVNAPGFGSKAGLLQEIDAFARARDPRVVQVSCSIAGERREVEILRADGRTVRGRAPARAAERQRDGGARRAARVGLLRRGRPRQLPPVDPARRLARAGGRGATPGAGQPGRGRLPRRRDGRGCWALGGTGVLLHEAVGHGLEGDFNRKGLSAFSGRIGERVAAPGVTVVDDGTLPGRRGSLTVDDEGTPTRAHRADRGRHTGRLHARSALGPADGPGRDRQRAPPELRPHAHAPHDQHRHDGWKPTIPPR